MPLVNAGINIIAQMIINSGTPTLYTNANAYIGVGDSSTNTTPLTYTDLQASTNKLRKAMDATYPQIATNVLTFQSTFASSDANFAWAEWAIFNAGSSGTMLSRKVESNGTKSSGQTWIFQVQLTLSVGT